MDILFAGLLIVFYFMVFMAVTYAASQAAVMAWDLFIEWMNK